MRCPRSRPNFNGLSCQACWVCESHLIWVVMDTQNNSCVTANQFRNHGNCYTTKSAGQHFEGVNRYACEIAFFPVKLTMGDAIIFPSRVTVRNPDGTMFIGFSVRVQTSGNDQRTLLA